MEHVMTQAATFTHKEAYDLLRLVPVGQVIEALADALEMRAEETRPVGAQPSLLAFSRKLSGLLRDADNESILEDVDIMMLYTA
jgi:hypothetical protein